MSATQVHTDHIPAETWRTRCLVEIISHPDDTLPDRLARAVDKMLPSKWSVAVSRLRRRAGNDLDVCRVRVMKQVAR